MNTIVVKGSNYSVLEVRALENSKIRDINVVLVYPSGVVHKIQTNMEKLVALTDDISDSFIYQ